MAEEIRSAAPAPERALKLDHFSRPVWHHERRGSYLLARIVCALRGHDWETWEQGVDFDGVFVADEDAVEIVTVRGDCRRCWG